jgi:hypothetical protein
MPIEKLHKDKKAKNYALLAAIVVFIFFMFGLTIVRLSAY